MIKITQDYTDTHIVITVENEDKKVTGSIPKVDYHNYVDDISLYEETPRPDPIMEMIDQLKGELNYE